MKIISFGNIKGGVGKTTITFNLAHILKEKYKVLVCDFDYTQSNLSTLFNIDITNYTREDYMNGQLYQIGNLYILPINPNVAKLDYEIFVSINRERFLYNKLFHKFEDLFDYVLIDLAPTFSQFVLNAFSMSDIFVAVCSPDTLSYESLLSTKLIIDDIKENVNTKLKLTAVINRTLTKRKINNIYINKIEQTTGVIPVHLPEKEIIRKAINMHKPVSAFYSTQYKEYTKLYKAIIKHINRILDNQ